MQHLTDLYNIFFQIDKKEEEMGIEVKVRVLPMTSTAVRFVTHNGISKSDAEITVKKLHYVIRSLEETC